MARSSKYPQLSIDCSPHVRARIHATATVLKMPVSELIESTLDARVRTLDDQRRELIDRIAASLVTRTELGDQD